MKNMHLLRYAALSEGVSWLLLLFVAMPLKYIGGEPIYVKIVGMTHGVLFLALVGLIASNLMEERLSKKEALRIFVASFIPFGTFITDRSLREEIAALEAAPEHA